MRASNYDELLARGQRYEAFVYELVEAYYGVKIRPCRTFGEQMSVGENYNGLEVKCQERCRQYGALVIETAETRPSGEWVPSGIWRGDNSRALATGDWETVWIFKIPHLQAEAPMLKRYSKPTSKGHILPINRADEICVAKLYAVQHPTRRSAQ